MSISIIIPCHGNDYIYIKPLISYINNFLEEKPDCISIAISGINEEQFNDLKKHTSSIPLIFTFTGIRTQTGTNRNIAINKTKSDYILALDSDDIPNPNIITIYKSIIKKNPYNIILSSYDFNPINLDFKKIFTETRDTDFLRKKTLIKSNTINCDFNIANGSGLLIKRQIFNYLKYPNKTYGEDSFITKSILFKQGNVIAINFNAIAYFKDDNLLKKHYKEILNIDL